MRTPDYQWHTDWDNSRHVVRHACDLLCFYLLFTCGIRYVLLFLPLQHGGHFLLSSFFLSVPFFLFLMGVCHRFSHHSLLFFLFLRNTHFLYFLLFSYSGFRPFPFGSFCLLRMLNCLLLRLSTSLITCFTPLTHT